MAEPVVDLLVTLSPEDATAALTRYIVEGSFSGQILDRYRVVDEDGKSCLTVLYEKFYYRAGNRMTLTVTVDNLSGVTRVHAVSGGGGQGAFFKFDWFAEDSFLACVQDALGTYRVQ